jgi:hypothetical protein
MDGWITSSEGVEIGLRRAYGRSLTTEIGIIFDANKRGWRVSVIQPSASPSNCELA